MKYIASVIVLAGTAAAAPHTMLLPRDTTESGVVHTELFGGPARLYYEDIAIDASWHPVDTQGQSVSRIHNTWSNTLKYFYCQYFPSSVEGDFHSGAEAPHNLGSPKPITHMRCIYEEE